MAKSGLLGLLLICSVLSPAAAPVARWSESRANEWYAKQPWLVGSNYIPATAINELEMWQAETFDPQTIDKELGWAESLGMTTMRVFLHDLAWQQDADGLSRAHQSLPGHRRATPHQAVVRALRFVLGSGSETGTAAGSTAGRAQLRVAAKPRRQGAAGSQGVSAAQSVRHGRRDGVRQGLARAWLGRLERAGQHEHEQLWQRRAEEQGRSRARSCCRRCSTGRARPASNSR